MPKILFELQGDPTVFSFVCSSPVTLGSIEQSFPLPGTWHFRGKVEQASGEYEYVWQDMMKENKGAKVPSYQGQIYLKAFPININAYSFEESDDLITVDEENEILPDDTRTTASKVERPNSRSTEGGTTNPTSGISMFGKAFASFGGAAMEAVRKNVGN